MEKMVWETSVIPTIGELEISPSLLAVFEMGDGAAFVWKKFNVSDYGGFG